MPSTANAAKPYFFETTEARSFAHPIFPASISSTFSYKRRSFLRNLPTGANARDPVGMNRRVYRDVTESLKGSEAWPEVSTS